MKNLTRRIPHPALTLTISFCLACLLFSGRTMNIMEDATKKVERCLSNAINKHREKVFSKNSESFTYIYLPKEDPLAFIILGSRSMKLPARAASDLQEVLKKVQHTILHDERAVDYVLLNRLFQAELRKEQLPSGSFIQARYQQPAKTVVYHGNKAGAAFTVQTRPILLGVSQELSISGGVQLTPSAIFRLVLSDPLILFVLAGGIAWAASLFKPQEHPPAPLTTVEKQDIAVPHRYATIRLYQEDHSVYIGAVRVDTGPRNFALLMMFLSNEERFVSRDQIIEAFWSAKVDCSDRLNTTINRLRSILKKSDPNLRIITGAGGYRLVSTEDIESVAPDRPLV